MKTAAATKSVIIKACSNVRAGGIGANHNRTLAVRSRVRAGGIGANHNRALR